MSEYTEQFDGPPHPEAIDPAAERVAGSLQQPGCASPYDKLKLSYLERQMEMCDQMLTASGVPEWVMNLDANGVPANSLPSRLKWYLARRKDVAAGEIDQELQSMMEENLRLAQARHNDQAQRPLADSDAGRKGKHETT